MDNKGPIDGPNYPQGIIYIDCYSEIIPNDRVITQMISCQNKLQESYSHSDPDAGETTFNNYFQFRADCQM